jgi:hypothetical protein
VGFERVRVKNLHTEVGGCNHRGYSRGAKEKKGDKGQGQGQEQRLELELSEPPPQFKSHPELEMEN